MTSEFDRKYLWNGWSYRQVANSFFNSDLSTIERKNLVNFGPLTKKLLRLMLATLSQQCMFWIC